MTMFVHRRTRVDAAVFKRAVRDLERAALRLLRDLDMFRGCKRLRVLLPLHGWAGVAHDLTRQPQSVRAVDDCVSKLQTPSRLR